jgi:hypothetical protein
MGFAKLADPLGTTRRCQVQLRMLRRCATTVFAAYFFADHEQVVFE